MQFPEGFIKHIADCDGFDEIAFNEAHQTNAQVSVRLNPEKLFDHNYTDAVPWCANAFYLQERPQFVFDPLHHAGAYYVQEASSMFTGYLFSKYTNANSALNILDLCAAPGGKSTLIAGLMNAKSLLVSNEVINARSRILKENIDKWGNPNVIVSNNDPSDFSGLTNFFDVIIVDAPCSGSGLFRKEPESMNEWSLENVNHCSKRQSRILDDIIPTLKPTGILIYATCSYSYDEDEAVIQTLTDKGFEIILDSNLPIQFKHVIQNKWGYRFYPDKIRGEGFFVSILQKKDGAIADANYYLRKYETISISEKEMISPFLKDPDELFFFKHKDVIYCLPEAIKQQVTSVGSLRLIKSGVAIGTIKNGNLIPDHELAMSTLVSTAIPSILLDEKMAIEYLRKNTIQPEHTLTGWCLIKFKNINLGWAKVVPGRINNYYPTAWRIRK